MGALVALDASVLIAHFDSGDTDHKHAETVIAGLSREPLMASRQPLGGAGQGRLRTVGWSRPCPQRVLGVVTIPHPPHPAALAHCAAGPSGPRLPARADALPVGWRRSDTFTTTYDRLRLPSVP